MSSRAFRTPEPTPEPVVEPVVEPVTEPVVESELMTEGPSGPETWLSEVSDPDLPQVAWPPIIIPVHEETNMNADTPLVKPDPAKIEEALATLGKQATPYLPKALRKKIYGGVKWGAGLSTAIGVSGLAVAPAVGGQVGGYIALGAGIATIVGSALGALAASLAEGNTDTSLDA